MLKVRLVRSRAVAPAISIPRGGRLLGEVEEYFIELLAPGDTFVFAGEVLHYEALVEDEVYVSRAIADDPQSSGLRGRQVSALDLSGRARARAARRRRKPGARCRTKCANGSEIQQWRSLLPQGRRAAGRDLSARRRSIISSAIRSRAGWRTRRWACCSRAGWSARGCARSASSPTNTRWRSGASATSALRIRRGDLSLAALFDQDMLGDDLEAWLAESALMKRTFRTCAIIAGLIETPLSRQGEDRAAR